MRVDEDMTAAGESEEDGMEVEMWLDAMEKVIREQAVQKMHIEGIKVKTEQE
jgi:hypothetical protein